MLQRFRSKPTIETLGRLEAFRGCTRAELRDVVRNSCELDLAEGHILCEEGAFGRQAFVIISGEAEVTIGGRRVTTVGTGSMVGEMALLEDRPRVATVTALTPLRVLVFSAPEFAQMVGNAPTAVRRLATTLSARLRQVEETPIT